MDGFTPYSLPLSVTVTPLPGGNATLLSRRRTSSVVSPECSCERSELCPGATPAFREAHLGHARAGACRVPHRGGSAGDQPMHVVGVVQGVKLWIDQIVVDMLL
uniref:Uncharacterized protein n=1 Tax=Oryza glumipatula TaxID=40148 RepID=A0A0E0A1M1_9ORYZ